MSNPLQDRIDQVMADFERSQTAIDSIREELADSTTTVTAKNRAVEVTVDGQGEVTEITFPTKKYRSMAPAELGSLLVETLADARQQAVRRATTLMRTAMPNSGPLLEALGGDSGEIDALVEELSQMDGPLWQVAESYDRKEDR
ncbi:MAG: YbaB/EbfC family nucleoid-associated protein [Micromonosporaceae bacterium]